MLAAPGGFGKTTLVAAAATSTPWPPAAAAPGARPGGASRWPSTGLILESEGAEAALNAVDGMLDHATQGALPAIERYLAALRVSLLADAGRVAAAERIWRAAALPASDADCPDLDHQGWRELEAIANARLRLLRARRHKGTDTPHL